MQRDPQENVGPARFVRLCVEGYRSFGAPLRLDGLDRIVVLYGLNNAGKTNLLRAIELVARLLDQPLTRLLDGAPEHQEMFFKRTGQEPWMFAQGGPEIVRLEVGIAPGDQSIAFEVARTGDRIRTRLSSWSILGEDHGTPATTARRRQLDSLRDNDEPSAEAQEAVARFDTRWEELRRSLRTAWSGSWLPISNEVRAAFVQLGRVPDLARRARAQRARDTFAKVTIGLPEGSLQDLSVPLPEDSSDFERPRVRDDVAWVSPGGLLPLDHLGSGAQAIFGLLASLALADAPVILIDEPEQHLNVLQQDAILGALQASLEGTGLGQIFIATHSVKFAKADLDLWQLQSGSAGTEAVRVTPPMLRPYEVRGVEGPRAEDTSLVAHDGSVELPAYVREALHIEPGQFVYFVKDGEGGFRIVSAAQMKQALEGE
jgi:AAA domain, putative AbiEii toxin, Type IV TA system